MPRTLKYCIGIYLSIFLSGCSMPMGFSAASWAIDGASYIATKKSLTDHGLSFIAGQDCALYRLVSNLNICQDYDDPTFGVIRKVEASELIENQIAKYYIDEIYYSFDMHIHEEDILVSDGLEFPQNNNLLDIKYSD